MARGRQRGTWQTARTRAENMRLRTGATVGPHTSRSMSEKPRSIANWHLDALPIDASRLQVARTHAGDAVACGIRSVSGRFGERSMRNGRPQRSSEHSSGAVSIGSARHYRLAPQESRVERLPAESQITRRVRQRTGTAAAALRPRPPSEARSAAPAPQRSCRSCTSPQGLARAARQPV